MFSYLCMLQSAESVVTYHFFASQSVLKPFVRSNINNIWKIYKLSDVTEYWVSSMKHEMKNESENQSPDVV